MLFNMIQMKNLALCALICTSLLVAGKCLAQSNGRERKLIDTDWKFSREDTVGAEKPGFNDGRWRVLDLPHDWSIEHAFDKDAPTGGGGGYLPTGVGWYRKRFTLPRNLLSKSVSIEFEGVYQNSDVWLNGHHLGHYPNGYMSFWYDLTPHLKAGENVIAVRVDNSRQPNTRWYSGSGIYRHVWITTADPVHIKQWGTYITTPKVDSNSAVVAVQTTIEQAARAPAGTLLRAIITDNTGKEVARMETPATGKGTVNLQMTVTKPSLWSVKAPTLYKLHTEIRVGTKLLDRTTTSFGIRHIAYDAKRGFLLNGERVKMNGVCLHHDGGSVGAAVPLGVWVRRFQVLKEMGCNAIRTSHNPMAPEFLDLCDSMGFLVQNEVFDEWKAGKVKWGYSNYFDEWSQKDLVNFIHRDRNHPSVVMWSAGNEIGEQKQEKGYEILRALIETLHREDPTRPVTTGNDQIAAEPAPATLTFLNMLDIVGYNYVDRWRDRRELFYSIDKLDHPEWKMIGTENVSVSGVRGQYFGGVRGGVDSTVIRPVNLPGLLRAEQLWKFTSAHDYVIGDFMWTGIDYLGEARWPSKNSSSGVIDLCGFPKDAYYFYQSQWTDAPMAHIFPHWNWPGREGKVIPVMVYTNCDSVELFLNGKSFGMKALEFPRQGNAGGWNRYATPPVSATTADLHLTWDVPYEKGTLRIVGRKNGKIAVEKELRTTGVPAALRVSMDKSAISADGTDVAHIKIEAVDANGSVVPDASNPVTLQVLGEGRLIGFDNGNPQDHTSMKSNTRKLFNGLALGVVQSSRKKGMITIKASAPGLPDITVQLPVTN